ncbi:MAG: hypothetical protein ACRC8S_18045 [Fimbriiglobus sp.]
MNRWFTVFGLGLLLILGCGESKPKVYKASGKVMTKSGKPCDNALVVFHPLDPSRVNDAKPVATTDKEGNFVLQTYAENDGAMEGEYGVTIVWNGSSKAPKLSLGGEGSTSPDLLQGRYGDPRAPKIKEKVTAAGPNEFKLTVE